MYLIPNWQGLKLTRELVLVHADLFARVCSLVSLTYVATQGSVSATIAVSGGYRTHTPGGRDCCVARVAGVRGVHGNEGIL